MSFSQAHPEETQSSAQATSPHSLCSKNSSCFLNWWFFCWIVGFGLFFSVGWLAGFVSVFYFWLVGGLCLGFFCVCVEVLLCFGLYFFFLICICVPIAVLQTRQIM